MEKIRLRAKYNSRYNRIYGRARNGVIMLVLYGARKSFPILAKQIKEVDGKCVDIEISMEIVK